MKYFQITLVMGLFFAFVLVTNLVNKDSLAAMFSEGSDEHHVSSTPLSLSGGSNSAGASSNPSPAASSSDPRVTAVPASDSSSSSNASNGLYKDGQYTGTSEYAYYGYVQVKAVVANGKLSDIVILDHPTHNRTSDYINSQALPLLTAAAISAQSADIGRVSGASDTSIAFKQSLANALAQAK